MRQAPWAGRLWLLLWPLGIAAEVTAFVFLFRDRADVTVVDVVNRSVGGSFVACGLLAWQLRPDSRIGRLMTLTGFAFLTEAVLSGIDSSVAYTLSQWSGNWWTPFFAALVLSFPSGRLSSRIDWAIVGAFVFGAVVLLPARRPAAGRRGHLRAPLSAGSAARCCGAPPARARSSRAGAAGRSPA